MSKYTYSLLFVSINEDVSAALLISLHGDNNEDYDKQDIVTNIYIESIVPSIKITYSSAHG